MNTDKPCYGRPQTAHAADCDRCHAYLRKACGLEVALRKAKELAASASIEAPAESGVPFADIYARIQDVTGCRTQVDLCQQLAVRQSSISDAVRRKSVPASWLLALLRLHGGNPDWILTGTGGRYLVATDEAPVAG